MGTEKVYYAVVGILLEAAACFWLGAYVAQSVTRFEAAHQGAGVYLADPKTGETRFYWMVNN